MTGGNTNGELTFLDWVSVLSFLIGVKNLDLNVTQEDAQRLERQLSEKTDLLLREIHTHLESQDNKIDEILTRLNNGGINDSRRNILEDIHPHG